MKANHSITSPDVAVSRPAQGITRDEALTLASTSWPAGLVLVCMTALHLLELAGPGDFLGAVLVLAIALAVGIGLAKLARPRSFLLRAAVGSVLGIVIVASGPWILAHVWGL